MTRGTLREIMELEERAQNEYTLMVKAGIMLGDNEMWTEAYKRAEAPYWWDDGE